LDWRWPVALVLVVVAALVSCGHGPGCPTRVKGEISRTGGGMLVGDPPFLEARIESVVAECVDVLSALERKGQPSLQSEVHVSAIVSDSAVLSAVEQAGLVTCDDPPPVARVIPNLPDSLMPRATSKVVGMSDEAYAAALEKEGVPKAMAHTISTERHRWEPLVLANTLNLEGKMPVESAVKYAKIGKLPAPLPQQGGTEPRGVARRTPTATLACHDSVRKAFGTLFNSAIDATVRFDAISESGVVLAYATESVRLLPSVRSTEVSTTFPVMAPEVAARIAGLRAEWVYGR
jgi:hypothetical protein